MKCKVCGRTLKNPTLTQMGKVCASKAHRLSESGEAKRVRVEPLFLRRQPRRTYLVFSSPRVRVVVNEEGADRFAVCQCSENTKCEHIQIVAEIDRSRFPELAAA